MTVKSEKIRIYVYPVVLIGLRMLYFLLYFYRSMLCILSLHDRRTISVITKSINQSKMQKLDNKTLEYRAKFIFKFLIN